MASSSNSEEKGTVRLQSNDGAVFEVEKSVAVMCGTLKLLIEDNCASTTIPVPIIDCETLARVIKYCKKHADEMIEEKDLEKFDKEFFDVDQVALYSLLMAANFLNVKDLLDKLCEKVASMMRGKSTEEIRETFNIVTDFTPEEEAEIRKENAFAFDDQ